MYNIIKELSVEEVLEKAKGLPEQFTGADLAMALQLKDGSNISVHLGKLLKNGDIVLEGSTHIKDSLGRWQKRRVYRLPK